MEIVTFEKEMAAGVARCYNELVEPMPYSSPVAREAFSDFTHAQLQGCTEEEILVARDAGEVAGFVHVGVSAPPTHKWHIEGEPGVIRFLSYRRGERPVGAALLQAAEQWARERERTAVVAEYGGYMYPFYLLPLGNISEQISHVPPLFGMAGYEVPECEVFFEWRDFQPPEVSAPDADVELLCKKPQAHASGLKVSVAAVQGEEQVGEFSMLSLREDRWRPQLADWCTAGLLCVADRLQGRGIGKCLVARGLTEMRKAGLRHAMISTDWNNWRAYLFYTNFGFRFLDRTFGFRKRLTAGQ
ncbi:MAG: GNAT family N-acetyltransferase [Armatimonadota bacterium]|nr:MAG: GNAT family N-acetyltransferase [Armatimonadota bacterium]